MPKTCPSRESPELFWPLRWIAQKLIDLSCGRWGGPPRKTPATYQQAYEDVEFYSADGTRLSGWLLPHPQPKGVVLLCHGIYSTRTSVLPKAFWCSDWGYTCLLFDFRGRGASAGSGCTLGYGESEDVQAAVNYIKEQPNLKHLPLLAIGESLGGAALILSEAANGRIDGLFLEACFSSLDEAIERRCRWIAGPWAATLKSWVVSNLENRLGRPISDLSPVAKIGQIHKPIQIVHDQLDWGVSSRASQQLYQAACHRKDYWMAPLSLHVKAAVMARVGYKQRLRDFLTSQL